MKDFHLLHFKNIFIPFFSFPRQLLWFNPLHRYVSGLQMTISHLLCKLVTQCVALEPEMCGFASLEEFSKEHTSCQQKPS